MSLANAEAVLDHLGSLVAENILLRRHLAQAEAEAESLRATGKTFEKELLALSQFVQEEKATQPGDRIVPLAHRLLVAWRREILQLRARLSLAEKTIAQAAKGEAVVVSIEDTGPGGVGHGEPSDLLAVPCCATCPVR